MNLKVLPAIKATVGLIPKTLAAINIAINTVCSIGVVTAVAHKATDGESTARVLDLAESALGEQRVRAIGTGARDSASYLGEGLVGVGQHLNDRYAIAAQGSPLLTPPISRVGYLAESVAIGSHDLLSVGASEAQKGFKTASLDAPVIMHAGTRVDSAIPSILPNFPRKP
jgi:hypothetical protein